MVNIKLPQLQKILCIALVAIGASSNTLLLAQAQTLPPLPDNGAPTQRPDAATRAQNPPTPPPPDKGSPGQREGAASRGHCVRVNNRLTALAPLVPKTSADSQGATPAMMNSGVVLGLTASERPNFWFYVPYSLRPGHPVEFLLQDEMGKDIYQTTLSGSATAPGVMDFNLPPTAPGLEVGKRYRWFFTVYCNEEQSVLVEGWVERVALNPSLETQLAQATPQEKIALYRQAGIWYEAVTTLAQLRRQNPNDPSLKAEWTSLLQSIGLEAIAQEPITAILTPKPQPSSP